MADVTVFDCAANRSLLFSKIKKRNIMNYKKYEKECV